MALKAKLKKSLESKNAFIIKYFQNNQHNDRSIDIACVDHRRAVFISLCGLYKTWKQCPSVVLYTAIFVLPINTDWIYHLSKYRKRRKCNVNTDQLSDNLFRFLELAESDEFIKLLKWKDSQGLLFCALDKYERNALLENSLIHPFWYYMSKELSNMYDGVMQQRCKPLLLDDKWWCGKQFKSKYNVNADSVLCELYFVSMKYKTMQEIIYQSNPKSLCPIVSYDVNNMCVYPSNKVLYECIAEDERNDWVILDVYDPDDI